MAEVQNNFGTSGFYGFREKIENIKWLRMIDFNIPSLNYRLMIFKMFRAGWV